MVSKLVKGKVENLSVNACLAPLCLFDGTAIVTIEGIGNRAKGMHESKFLIIFVFAFILFYFVNFLYYYYYYYVLFS